MDRTAEVGDRRTTSELVRLQEHERSIARRLSDAREKAEDIVQAAREKARRSREETERSLDEASEKLRREVRAEVDARRRTILEAAARRVRRLDGISEDRIGELADRSFLRLIGQRDLL